MADLLVCQGCEKKRAIRRRQNTAYVDDERNFATLCPECQDEADKYWKEEWDNYYNMVL